MNIRFSYLYRDAGNFKKFGDVVFSNPNDSSIAELTLKVKRVLVDEIFFDAYVVGVPELFFDDYDEELDHAWHEFERLDVVDLSSTDHQQRSIEDFILRLTEKKLT